MDILYLTNLAEFRDTGPLTHNVDSDLVPRSLVHEAKDEIASTVLCSVVKHTGSS